jgi:TRAP-type C4-dicarboxylate transport system permease small subunit
LRAGPNAPPVFLVSLGGESGRVNFIDRMNTVIGENAAWLFLAGTAVTCYEVVLRYLFNDPTTWAFELTILFCAIGYLLSGGYVTMKRSHIAITSLYEQAPPKLRKALDVFNSLVGLGCMSLLLWSSFNQAVYSVTIWERTGSAWDPPLPAILKPLIVVGTTLIILQLLVNIRRSLNKA